jgi:photosystem II stability/assembly factor-like uncharacterized protein
MGTNVYIFSFTTLGNNIFAGTWNFQTSSGGVYISTNSGTSWTQTALNNQCVLSLTISGNNIFAGTYSCIYLSTNNGTSWTQTALNNHTVLSLAANGNILFAGTSDDGLYVSTNTGISWIRTSLNYAIISLCTLGNNIFAGTNNGVYLSTNNGNNWSQTALNHQYINVFATIGSYIFAGTDEYGLYVSTNNGTSWYQTALNHPYVYSLATFENNIFAGTLEGVYFSTNNGVNWLQKNQGFNPIPTTINELLIANNYIFAGTDGNSIFRRSYSEIIGIQNISTEIPSGYSLHQNHPNPFNPTTKIKFDIAEHSVGQTFLSVYDITGREIQTLVNEKLNPGTYEVTFDGSNFASGVYFYQLKTGDFIETRKLVLLK